MKLNSLRVILTLLTIIIVIVFGTLAISYAKGYRFDRKTFKFVPSGLLVIKSDPDGAQVFINGEFKTATNDTLSLQPGTYDISIKKDGYFDWAKRLKIEKEIVTEATAKLFRTAPSLSAVTFSGALNPIPSPDFTKIAYITPPITSSLDDKEGLWVIETLNLPLGFTKDPRKITDGNLVNAEYLWSPSGQEILLLTNGGTYLLEADKFTPQNQRVNVSIRKSQILADWEKEQNTKTNSLTKKLPEELVKILDNTTSIFFSPDETKLIYTAGNSGELAENLIKPYPGASTQKQERDIKKGRTYLYDIKEDRNFLIYDGADILSIGNSLIESSSKRLAWFPTSEQLILAEQGKVIIMDYDGTNQQVVYSGTYSAPHAFPTVNRDRLLILTNLGANGSTPNLYSLSVK